MHLELSLVKKLPIPKYTLFWPYTPSVLLPAAMNDLSWPRYECTTTSVRQLIAGVRQLADNNVDDKIP